MAKTATTKPASGRSGPTSAGANSDNGSTPELFEFLVHQELVSYRDVNAYAGTDLDIVASRIAVEVTFALSEQIEDLNVYSSNFRMSLHKLARWILVSLFERTERCVVVPDAIPGFTAMGFKRAAFDLNGRPVELSPPSIESGSVERQAATLIMERFLEKAKAQVVVVECKDLLLVLFPVPDLKNNLRKLGLLGQD